MDIKNGAGVSWTAFFEDEMAKLLSTIAIALFLLAFFDFKIALIVAIFLYLIFD